MSNEALKLLRERRNELSEISGTRANWEKISAWHTRTRPLIGKYFGQELEAFDKLGRVQWVGFPRVIARGTEAQNRRTDELERSANEHVVGTAREKLLRHMDALIELVEIEESADKGKIKLKGTGGATSVFLVHGHNERWLQQVARFIEQFGLRVIILREEPNEGKTIIEKFENYAGTVGFAVILLTGDDKGGPCDADPAIYQARARQNVVLELGFFLSELGRSRVCALYEEGVEIPSDYSGVLFVPMSGDSWKLPLAREMKAAGLPVDLNLAV